jgi:hypothetical protein
MASIPNAGRRVWLLDAVLKYYGNGRYAATCENWGDIRSVVKRGSLTVGAHLGSLGLIYDFVF